MPRPYHRSRTGSKYYKRPDINTVATGFETLGYVRIDRTKCRVDVNRRPDGDDIRLIFPWGSALEMGRAVVPHEKRPGWRATIQRALRRHFDLNPNATRLTMIAVRGAFDDTAPKGHDVPTLKF